MTRPVLGAMQLLPEREYLQCSNQDCAEISAYYIGRPESAVDDRYHLCVVCASELTTSFITLNANDPVTYERSDSPNLQNDPTTMTLLELQIKAKQLGLTGYSTQDQPTLLARVQNALAGN